MINKVYLFLALMVALGLNACTSLDWFTPVSKAESSVAAQAQEAPSHGAQSQAAELTADLLYDLLLSQIAFQRGELDVAVESMAKAAQNTQNTELLSRAIRLAIHNENFTLALDLGQLWISVEEQESMAHIITALAASLDDQNDKALEILENLLQQNPADTSALIERIGDVYLLRAKGNGVILMMAELANRYPKQLPAWLAMAGLAQKNQDFDNMLYALDKVLRIDHSHQAAAGYKLHALSQDQPAQVQFARQFLKQNPSAYSFHLQYARLLLQHKQADEALKSLLALLDKQADNSEAINLVALLYQDKQDYQKAAKYHQLHLLAKPQDGRSRLIYANTLQHLKRFDEAKAQLQHVTEPVLLFEAQRQMAQVIEIADGLDKALLYLDELQVSSPAQQLRLIADREFMLKRAERFDQALLVLNDGLKRFPDNTNLLYHRALLHIDLDSLTAHEVDMRVLLEVEPENAHYHNTLGYSLLTMSARLEEAGKLIDKAYSLLPEDPYILDSKGWLEFKRGHNEAALKFLHQAFELDQDAEIAAHIGEIYWLNGDQQKARLYWEKGDKIEPDSASLKAVKAHYFDKP